MENYLKQKIYKSSAAFRKEQDLGRQERKNTEVFLRDRFYTEANTEFLRKGDLQYD